jgi:DNA-binding NarL/FixJ family response regulator
MQYSVVVVDDHILIAKAIAGIIDAFPNFNVLYEVAHGKELMERFRNAKNIPDIVLLDISMPVMDGFETAGWLKENHPDVLILTLSMQDDDRSLIRMIQAGSKGYLLKNVEPEELNNALKNLVSKGFYYPDWATSKVFVAMASGKDQHELSTLEFTAREQEFLNHCCTEMNYREIAEKMFVSPRTVEGYRDACFEKLGLKTRVGLVMWLIKSGRYIL